MARTFSGTAGCEVEGSVSDVELVHHFLGVLAKARRRNAKCDTRAREMYGIADEFEPLPFTWTFEDHAVLNRLRVIEGFAHIAHGSAEDVLFFKLLQPVIPGAGKKRFA